MEAIEKLVKAIGAVKAAQECWPGEYATEAVQPLVGALDAATKQAIEDAQSDAE